MDLQLRGRRALVTGGSRGIGKAIALALAREGVDCALVARSREPLEAAASEIAAATGRRVVAVPGDASDPASVRQSVDTAAEALGGLEILVNNGARVSGSVPEDLAHASDEMLLRDFEEKFVGYLRFARATVPRMLAGGWGRIVNVSGGSARSAGAISAGARNVAVVNLTKNLALELGRQGIQVNAVYPGFTVTEAFEDRIRAIAGRRHQPPAEVAEQMAARTSIGRLVTAEDIGAIVAFLCSPLASAINGEVIAATGGGDAAVYY